MITSIIWTAPVCRRLLILYFTNKYTFREFCAILLSRLVLEETASCTSVSLSQYFMCRVMQVFADVVFNYDVVHFRLLCKEYLTLV